MKKHSGDNRFWNKLFNMVSPPPTDANPAARNFNHEPENYGQYSGSSVMTSNWMPVNTYSFDGEKTPGEMGAPINLIPEHTGLRYRAYEAQLKSDVIKIITGKFFKWVIGNGLKLQAEPEESILKSEGINEDLVTFRKSVESRFKIYSESRMSDFSKMTNLHRRASEAFKTAFLSGDALVVCRIENQNINIQTIDGSEIKSPVFESKYYKEAEARGNKILHGIEINKRGEHVAFFVATGGGDLGDESERITARGESTGRLMAWMVYGDKHRINHHRGIPRISAILEKVDKLDRYTEASVAGAEERAKIVFAIEHSKESTGENPMVEQLRKNIGAVTNTIDSHAEGAEVSKQITKTTSKQTFNMPIGAKLSTLASQQEDQYEPFFNAVFVQLCAAIDIPPEVALQKYSSNYSASRAAINGWGYVVDVYRKDFAFDFYKNIYRLWLEVEVLKGSIKAPGLRDAIFKNDEFLIEVYCNSKFTGVNMPHIDPLKEVKAVREMLGDPLKNQIPLISHDRASEQLNQGEWTENYLKYKEETKDIPVVTETKEEQSEPNNKDNESR